MPLIIKTNKTTKAKRAAVEGDQTRTQLVKPYFSGQKKKKSSKEI